MSIFKIIFNPGDGSAQDFNDQDFGGHDFEYQPFDDLFRCVRCGGYEVLLRMGSPTGVPGPCPGSDADTAGG